MAAKGKPKGKPRGARYVKGDPRAGRPKGCLNKATVEIREAARLIVEEPGYRSRFIQRAHDGKLAPALEAMIWHYAYGKPKERVEITGENGAPLGVTFYIPSNGREKA